MLQGDSISLAGSDVLDVRGGLGGTGPGGGGSSAGGGAGGGGGRINLFVGPGSYNIPGTFDLAGGGPGGAGAGFGAAGELGIFVTVPEPSSLILLATALPVAAYALRRRKRGQEPAEDA